MEPALYEAPVRTPGIPVYVPRASQDDFQSPSVPNAEALKYWCSIHPDEPYAYRQEITVEYEEVDEGVDWSQWYYLLVLSLPRRKVIYEIQRYYKTALYCDGSEGERELVNEKRYVYDEYNQASLFGVKDYLEWQEITISVTLDTERKRFEIRDDSPLLESHSHEVSDTPALPRVITPEKVDTGHTYFADVQVRQEDSTYTHLFTNQEVVSDELKGKILFRNELPVEFLAQNSGINAAVFEVVDVNVRRVTDDPSNDRRVVRYTIRELRNIF